MYIPNYTPDDTNDYSENPDGSVILDFLKIFSLAVIVISIIVL